MRTFLLAILTLSTLFIQAQSKDSLDIMIGQMILIGVSGTSVDANDPSLIAVKEGKAGSIIFFEKNIAKENSFNTMKKMVDDLQAAASIPLIISIDQEGGRVNRLKEKYGFPKSVTHKYLGKLGNTDSTYYYSNAMAANLAALGINMNFAPVVDLETEKGNPIIAKYGRSFSEDPDTVIMHSKIFIDAHHKNKVYTSLKHFPGHGSSKADTHMGIADVTKYWTDDELKPYKALIKSGHIDAIMSAHIVNKKLDKSGLPGTLSYKILHDLLRKSMGFDGVVFSDDMHMKAISEHYGLRESVKLAINAGIDIVTFSHNLPDQRESSATVVFNTIKDLVEKGEISEERIRQSYKRVMRLKGKMN